jgi:hypothetical protein
MKTRGQASDIVGFALGRPPEQGEDVSDVAQDDEAPSYLFPWRLVLPILGLLGMLAVVAVAAAGHSPAGGASRPSTGAPKLVEDYLATIALIMLPIGAFLIFWAAFLRRAYANVPLKKSPLYPGQIPPKPLVTVAFVFVVLFIAVRWGHPERTLQSGKIGAGGASKAQKTQPAHKQYEPHFQWLPVFVFGSLVVGLGGALAFLALRRRREEVEQAPVRETLAEVLGETLDDLRNEPDPRKAVIGAYAKMERTLAARGFPRQESEAPLEYLGRILGIVEGSGHSARRLTRLFERARFSPHDVDQKMKDDAIDSLVGLRAQLEADAPRHRSVPVDQGISMPPAAT